MDYIGIRVDQYPFAISCDGKYYKRSGSTLRELQGFELQNFLMERAGKAWDSMPIPGVSVNDLDKEALNAFRRKAVENQRMSESEVDVTGAYVKVAFFAPAGTYGMNSEADIIYKDDIHGPLITQTDKTLEILYTKYFKALISYEKLQRIETYMLSMGVIRELLLNPINHKQYEKGVPIQVSVFEDHVEIFNVGLWPTSIPVDDTLYQKHESIPYNPKIADVFYRAGEIESWGRGFLKIRQECEKIGAPLPIMKKSENGITMNAIACGKYLEILNINKREDSAKVVNEAISLLDGNGDWIVDDDGASIIVETLRKPSKEEKEWRERIAKAYEYMLEVCSVKLNEREKKKIYPIVEHFKRHDEIDRTTAQMVCGKSATTISYLNKLISIGVLKKEKSSVATIYKIADYKKSKMDKN